MDPGDIRAGYDALADEYAKAFDRELERKPFDREILERFAAIVGPREPVCDLGCGPGQTTAFLHARGVAITGVDLSPGLVRCARRLHPEVPFAEGDMLRLDAQDGAFAGIVAFYSIVNFDLGQVA